MTIGVLALVGVTPDRVAALTAAGYTVLEGKKYATRSDAVRAAAETVRAVLTNGRGGAAQPAGEHHGYGAAGTGRPDGGPQSPDPSGD